MENAQVRQAILEELLNAKRGLNNSLTLKERVLGVDYIGNSEEQDRFAMLYTTNKSRKGGYGTRTPVIGEINLEKDSGGELSLRGFVYGSHPGYERASAEFERVAHTIAHRFNVPLSFNLSK